MMAIMYIVSIQNSTSGAVSMNK